MASLSDLESYATQEAEAAGIPTNLFLWQIGQESSWNPNAQNGNASGIAQFMPGTAAEYGVNTSDPYSSISGAAHYDADLFAQTGSWQSALTQYGTLAGVGSSVMAGFQNALGLGSSATTGSGAPLGFNTSTNASVAATLNQDAWYVRIVIGALALILFAGAIYTYKK